MSFKSIVKGSLFVGALAVGGALMATDPVTLPSTGVDVAAYATAAITGLGAIIAVALGGYVAILLVKKALKWVKTALG